MNPSLDRRGKRGSSLGLKVLSNANTASANSRAFQARPKIRAGFLDLFHSSVREASHNKRDELEILRLKRGVDHCKGVFFDPRRFIEGVVKRFEIFAGQDV